MKISESIYSNMILLHVSNLPAYALNMPNCEHSKHILYPVERATPPQALKAPKHQPRNIPYTYTNVILRLGSTNYQPLCPKGMLVPVPSCLWT
jgi:hypothetical protein